MENPTVSGLRSRSRSKTPFLRSSCDHEHCTEGEEHTHKSGRRTPIKRSTPNKQLQQNSKKSTVETVDEEVEEVQPVHHMRQPIRSGKLVKTSDYSSEESLDRLRGYRKEIIQNEINSQYERVSTSTHGYSTLADVTLSPINLARNVTHDRSTRFSSPSFSACSTDSSFAEQALADASVLLDRDPSADHLPYRLYKMAGEYWNKYPKTDYTYSPLSRDRVELAPGQVAVPNMSRRSLSQFRLQGPSTVDEPDIPFTSVWKTSTVRKRITTVDSSDDEDGYVRATHKQQDRWWLSRLLVAMYTAVTTASSNVYRKVVGPSHRYPYTERRPKGGVMSSAAAAVAAPFSWVYMIISSVITTTVTTVTETFTSANHVGEKEKYVSREKTAGRRWWPWVLLLLLPAFGYGLHYTYENLEHLAMPNFTDFHLDLSEFTLALPNVSLPSLPSITLPQLPRFNITMPEINITLPDVSDNLPTLPEVRKTYRVYKEVMQNRMADASSYVKVVAESCWEEIRRVWQSYAG